MFKRKSLDMTNPVIKEYARQKAEAQFPLDAHNLFNGVDYSKPTGRLFVFEAHAVLMQRNGYERTETLMEIVSGYPTEADITKHYEARVSMLRAGEPVESMPAAEYLSIFNGLMEHDFFTDSDRPIWTYEQINGFWRARVVKALQAAEDFLVLEQSYLEAAV